MEKDNFALIRHVVLVCLFVFSTIVIADEEIYVAKEKDQYSDDESTAFNWNLDRFALQLNIASYHPNTSQDYNEFNRGLGIEYHLDSFFFSAGYFWNSLYRDSFYAGVGKEITFGEIVGNINWMGVGALAGAITGYRDGQRPRPAVVPYIFFTKDRYTFKIHYVPELGDVQDDAFGFALRIKLDGL